MSPITPWLRLPFSFDVARLQHELDQLQASQWVSHFNTSAYQNDWRCIPLRSVGGRPDHIMPLAQSEFRDTEIFDHCPYMREVVDQFDCEKTSIRLMALAPGGVIHEHRDDGASLDDGITRLHIPVRTSSQVLFRIEGQAVHFSAGDTWYLNAACLHGVTNHGTVPRVHLMLDCVTNPWLVRVFQAAGGQLREPPPYGNPAIHDGNVHEVIAALRAAGHSAGARLADHLGAIHAGRQVTDPRH